MSWNVAVLLRDCLNSLLSHHDDLSLQLVVVDNASTDGSAEMVGAEFPGVQLIPSESNLGFARANNLGLALASGRYVFFLNPDTIVKSRALSKMVSFLDGHHEFGMVGPRLVYPDGSIQRTCARLIPSLRLILVEALYLHRLPFLGQRLLNSLISPYDLRASQEVQAISGAAMMIRRDLAEMLGGFDEAYLHTGEDMDLCLRLRHSGSRIAYCADSEVLHFAARSSSQVFDRAAMMSFLSMGVYFERAYGPRQALIYRLIVRAIQMPMLVLVGFAKALAGRGGSPDLRERVKLARAIWGWRAG